VSTWQPTATRAALQARAILLQQIRAYFDTEQVLEVETPALSQFGVTDIHLQNLTVNSAFNSDQLLYLQTSPEYAMKRLLASGSGSIYQISKAFRDDELGRFHNPEFTLLEWYRVGFDDIALMDDVERLLQQVLDCQPARRSSYQALFIEYLGVDPLAADALRTLKSALANYPEVADLALKETDLDTLLQLAMALIIEPRCSSKQPLFVYDFPVSQAALAKVNPHDPRTAKRFELYYQGIELANGFAELTCAKTQAERFAKDNAQREQLGLAPMAMDVNFLQALEAGLPECAGVALGIDRLLMLQLNADSIADVLSFPVDRA